MARREPLPHNEAMTSLGLSIAVGDYDRTRALLDGTIPIDGVDPTFLALEPEEMFFRALRHAEFDVCELSMSSYCAAVARGASRYVAVPVFPSRAFRHTAFYVRAEGGIDSLEALRGRRVGLPEYQLTACVWARIIMSEAGVEPEDVTWVRAGIEQAGRPEKTRLDLPANVRLEDAGEGKTLSSMLVSAEIDAVVSPRAPSCFAEGHPAVRWLFADPAAAAREDYARTGIFPIMHLLALRRDVYERHRWVPSSLLKAFTLAKDRAIRRLEDNAALKVTLPFLEHDVARARRELGDDYWSYGFAPNRRLLDVFLAGHHRQGLSARRLSPEELFAEEALELYAV